MVDVALNPDSVARAEQFRRQKQTAVLTVMFTDMKGSTSLREEKGEQAFEVIREEHDAVLERIITGDNAGAVVASTGDGVLAVFAEPSTAVQRALAIQSELRDHPHLRLRIGLDMGQVSKETEGGIVRNVFGRHVNRASRIESLAEARHVLTSFSVYDSAIGWLLTAGVDWRNHGLASLKGIKKPVELFEPYDPQLIEPQRIIEEVPRAGARTLIERSLVLDREATPEFSKILGLGHTGASVGAAAENAVSGKPEPAGIASHKSSARKTLEDLAESLPLKERRLLWVDDFPENNSIMRELLMLSGVHIDIALSTEEAESKLEKTKYAVVISDMGRGQNPTAGLDLLKVMSKRQPLLPCFIFASIRAVARYERQAEILGASLSTSGTVSLFRGISDALQTAEGR